MKWKIRRNRIKENEYAIDNGILKTVFANRGLDPDIASALESDPVSILATTEVYGINDAAEYLIKYALKERRHVEVFADYDVDGLTSGYIITQFLRGHNASCDVYYPQRDELYGISMAWCERINEKYKDRPLERKPLIVTVDNGITKKREIAFLKSKGFPVLVTDHHEPQDDMIPDCVHVDGYLGNGDGRCLCGAGVIWNVLRRVEDFLNEDHAWTDYLLSFAALGTVADMMEMTPYNLAIVTVGLAIMNGPTCPDNIRLFRDQYCHGRITVRDLSWSLIPMLNACGRMGKIEIARCFFFSEDEENLLRILSVIDTLNKQRKSEENLLVKYIDSIVDLDHHIIFAVVPKDTRKGLLGLVAGKLLQKYGKPTFVVQEEADCVAGSFRSNTVGFQKLTAGAEHMLDRNHTGGHPFAAGISIKLGCEDEFVDHCDSVVEHMIGDGSFDKILGDRFMYIDKILTFNDLVNENRNALEILPNDRRSFPESTFAFVDLKLRGVSASKNNPENVKLSLTDTNGNEFDVWAWGWGTRLREFSGCGKVHLAGHLVRNFQKPRSTTISVCDIKPAVIEAFES